MTVTESGRCQEFIKEKTVFWPRNKIKVGGPLRDNQHSSRVENVHFTR